MKKTLLLGILIAFMSCGPVATEKTTVPAAPPPADSGSLGPPSIMWGVNDVTGCCGKIDPSKITSSAQFETLAKANVKIIRLGMFWDDNMNPSPGVYDWSGYDSLVDRARGAGLEVYLDVMSAPSWVSGGIPTYRWLADGCTTWKNKAHVTIVVSDTLTGYVPAPSPEKNVARDDTYYVAKGGTITIAAPGVLTNDTDAYEGIAATTSDFVKHGNMSLNYDGSFTYTHDGSDEQVDGFNYWVWGFSEGIRFAGERDYCSNAPHLDKDAVRRFASDAVQHFKGRVKYYGVWNEPDFDIFWPPQVNSRLWDEVTVPFSEEVHKDGCALFVGPECTTSTCLQEFLELEKASDHRTYDVISHHGYEWNGPWAVDALRRLDTEFLPVLEKYQQGRPVWIGETGPQAVNGGDVAQEQAYSDGVMEFAQGVINRGRYMVVFFYPSTSWVHHDGTPTKISSYFATWAATPVRRRQYKPGSLTNISKCEEK